jgi:hypothetical protein
MLSPEYRTRLGSQATQRPESSARFVHRFCDTPGGRVTDQTGRHCPSSTARDHFPSGIDEGSVR